MKKLVKAILTDIRRGQNIDSYATMLVCIVAIALSIAGVAKTEWVLSAVLVALVIQSAHFISEERKLDRVISTYGLAAGQTFNYFKDEDYVDRIKKATKIHMICVANFRFIAANATDFTDFVSRGGELREILLDPESQTSVDMSAYRSEGASANPDFTRSQINMTIEKLKEIASHQKHEGQVKVRKTTYLTAVIFTWFEFKDEPGVMCLTMTAFQQPTAKRPTVLVNEDRDLLAYEFFKAYYENIWRWKGSSVVL